MAKKAECQIGARFVINDKLSKDNSQMGAHDQHMFAFADEGHNGCFITKGNFSIPNGSVVEVTEPPKRKQNINSLRFKIVSIPKKYNTEVDDSVFVTFFVCFWRKADLLTDNT